MTGSRFVVRRRNWRWAPGNEHTPRGWVCFPGPGAEVAAFESFDAAEADRTHREAAVRLKMNPFECGPLPAVTTLPDPILRDFLMDAGVEPPAAGVAWADWWTAAHPTLSDEHRASVWQAADKVRFFEVTEEADGPQVHVVVDVTWEERDGVHVAEWDGGELIRARRSLKWAGEIARGRANQRRITLAGQHAVDAAPFADCRPSHVPDPFAPGSTHLLRLPRASFSEVVSIPFDDSRYDAIQGIGEDRVCVVIRHDYSVRPEGAFNEGAAYLGVPVNAFADWDDAANYATELKTQARSWFNPFSLGLLPEQLVFLRSVHRFYEFVRTLGVSPPHNEDWQGWWAEFIQPLPIQTRDQLWDIIALRLFTVVDVPFEK